MKLNQTAEYALRTMAYLALQKNKKPLSSKELAKQISIPPHYLSKILRKLVTAGLLVSKKGHGGGFILSRKSSRICFLDVLSAVDYHIIADKCVFGWGQCDKKNPCPLHNSWSDLTQQLLGWAKTNNLGEIG